MGLNVQLQQEMLEDAEFLRAVTGSTSTDEPDIDPEQQRADEEELAQMLEEELHREEPEEEFAAEILPFGEDMYELEEEETEELDEAG